MSKQAGTATAVPHEVGAPMSHRQILEALSGILLGLFVAILSSTIVSNALPTILADLHGGESAYTWVVTSTLLAMTASMPIWGKLADLTSKKVLIQSALVIYIFGSVIAGLAQNTTMLIGARAIQGLGAGGLSALGQIILAAMVSPRQRGRYSGYFGAVFALATVGGPLIGGTIVDTSWLGWRWCFYVGVPIAVIAILVLQKTLNLPVVKRHVKVDYLGAFLIAATVSLLLIWVSLAGHNYAWMSWQTAAMLGGTVLLGAAAIVTETRAAEPVIPLHLFSYRTVTLATLASVFAGVAMYSGTTFLSQYFQLSRGASPTKSGLMTMPMVLGLFVSSMVSGQLISRFGKWKRFLVIGTGLLAIGIGLMGTLRVDTNYWLHAVFMLLTGLGLGMTMQNLVLAVQNTVPVGELGAGSSVVSFFRTMGGAIGVSAFGAVLANKVSGYLTDNLAAAHVDPTSAAALQGGGIPNLHTLPAQVVPLVKDAYGHAIGDIFLYAAPFALVGFVVVWFIKEVALRTQSGNERAETKAADGAAGTDDADLVTTR
ncbi:MDR family MFS transporter [Streptomyces sp. SID3343]|uniref:MDR family MFS transporter n=1 Tax=Streptomyces sp. SID3343 TaxID=2690260 RepID=UPI00136FABAF|nr:MDR family MFS transporter [Streptomyces sp. SID3343]MYV99802.1 DHA2 family efflux MFS transporter permease subunit [Streptomyces sp. SID3343]